MAMIAAAGSLLLTACGTISTPYGASERGAAQGIAVRVDFIAQGLMDAALSAEYGVVTRTDLLPLAAHVFLTPEEQLTAEHERRASTIYGFSTSLDATSVDIFVPAISQVNAGLYSESTVQFGCGTLRVDAVAAVARIRDVPCPDWIVQLNSADARQVSLADVTKEEIGATEWHARD
ncbi:hypothetical protein [Microbacterium sp. SORGH_AS_0862]|uniref:hypothetical protein n=1 Tax=Microbacterium sp. SORGH_AS_0862 TaxID=3041789 RepID=UPI0027D79ACA|nr:hypothetical protein [Microbacterium sp. SORGH_AS_0862]